MLCLLLRRAGVSAAGRPTKAAGRVAFPLALDLAPYCAAGAPPLVPAPGPAAALRPGRPDQAAAEAEAPRQASLCAPRSADCAGSPPGGRPRGSACDGAGVGAAAGEPERSGGGAAQGAPRAACGGAPGERGGLERAPGARPPHRLVAVVVHHGAGAAGGHYTTFRFIIAQRGAHAEPGADGASAGSGGKAQPNGAGAATLGGDAAGHAEGWWVAVSDESVRPATAEEVLQSEATLLVYQQDAAPQ